MKQEHAINFSKCLKEAWHFGFQRVHNVCEGTSYDVPWGAFDWLGSTFLALLLLGLIGLIVMGLILLSLAIWAEFT